MRSSFIHVLPTHSVLQARQLMQLARIRHLPVLDADGRLAGIVSHRDVLEATASPAQGVPPLECQERLRPTPIARIMTAQVQTIGPEEPLRTAAEQMLRHKIGCLLVVAPPASLGRVVGLITESDLLAAAYLPGFDVWAPEPDTQPVSSSTRVGGNDGDEDEVRSGQPIAVGCDARAEPGCREAGAGLRPGRL